MTLCFHHPLVFTSTFICTHRRKIHLTSQTASPHHYYQPGSGTYFCDRHHSYFAELPNPNPTTVTSIKSPKAGKNLETSPPQYRTDATPAHTAALNHELSEIDEAMSSISLPRTSSWPIFLRGASHSRWCHYAQSSEIFLQLENRNSGLYYTHEYHHQLASSFLRSGFIHRSWKYFEKAHDIQVDRLGNENHFNYKFEDFGFRNDLLRRRSPVWGLQRIVCGYCLKRWKDVRETCIVLIFEQEEQDWIHSLIWFLAVSIKGGLFKSEGDTSLIMEYVQLVKKDWLENIVYMFLGKDLYSVDKIEEEWDRYVLENGGDAVATNERVFTAFYAGLYYDAVKEDEKNRDKWFERCVHLKGDEKRELADNDGEYDFRRFLVRMADLKVIGKEHVEEQEPAIL